MINQLSKTIDTGEKVLAAIGLAVILHRVVKEFIK